MKKSFSIYIYTIIFAVLFAGCAAQSPMTPFEAQDLNSKWQSGQFVQKADNFVILFDGSASMAEKYDGRQKFHFAKEIADRMSQTIPALQLNGALLSFGHAKEQSRREVKRVYGLKEYVQADFKQALDWLKYPGGGSPMETVIANASEDLKGSRGNIAVIIISDGKKTGADDWQAAKDMKDVFGDQLCIYTVLVGDDAMGTASMEKIAMAGQCGFSTTADEIASGEGMANFVERVFLARAAAPSDSDGDGVFDNKDQCPDTPSGVGVDSKGCPLDTDGDGVYDYKDNCPNTPAGVVVDQRGCPLDSDKDGVYDYRDSCPGTPRGAKVNKQGCWTIGDVLFDTAKASLKPAAYPELDNVVSVLNQNPALNIEIQGHTDSRGSERFNRNLSENRAKAVKDYLTAHGIDPKRLTTAGFGPARPIASNMTAQGRARNRRVQLQPIP